MPPLAQGPVLLASSEPSRSWGLWDPALWLRWGTAGPVPGYGVL